MARHAVGRDISLPAGGIANQNVQHMICTAVGDILDLQMQEFGDILELIVGHAGEGRHALFRAPLFQKGHQVLAMIVAQNHVGGDEVRTFRAARLGSVAEGTALLEQRRAACRRRLIRLGAETEKNAGCRRPLLRRAVEAAAGAAGRRIRPRWVWGGAVSCVA
jgi:hypothetical protein